MKAQLFLAALLTSGFFTACQSGKDPGSTSHAVVQINNHTLEEIQQTTAKVFGEDGYTQSYGTPELMVFERPGSRRDALKYGGWTGEGVTMRVRVAFTALAGGSYRLRADAYSVQNASDPFFQDENRAMMLFRQHYQGLLDEVAKQLK